MLLLDGDAALVLRATLATLAAIAEATGLEPLKEVVMRDLKNKGDAEAEEAASAKALDFFEAAGRRRKANAAAQTRARDIHTHS